MMSSSNSPHLGEAGPERARFLPAFPKPAAPTLPISEAWHTAKIRRLTSPNSRRDMILSAGFTVTMLATSGSSQHTVSVSVNVQLCARRNISIHFTFRSRCAPVCVIALVVNGSQRTRISFTRRLAPLLLGILAESVVSVWSTGVRRHQMQTRGAVAVDPPSSLSKSRHTTSMGLCTLCI